MKKLLFAAIVAMLPFLTLAQISVTGNVTDNNQKSLPGATIKLKGQKTAVVSDANGNYALSNLTAGKYVFSVSYVGYQTVEKAINLTANTTLNFSLNVQSFIADEVVVSATRASKNSATTFKNLNKEDLAKNNLGQDLPYLLNQTPSVVVSSDAGTGIGYTGIRIRGSDATRINVTINGIPLNDAESQGSYFINLPDLASSVDNIQIQRGVGTSTNGAGAFGGSLNIQTTTRRDSAYAELNNTYGSYNTWKNSINVGTGLINNKFSFDGRLSRIKSDGYVDRASSNLKSFFVSGAYYGKKDLLRVNVFSGTEKTYQAWNGVDEETLKTDRRHNDFTYDNQTDNYQQDHYQMFYTRTLSDKLVANAALHYTYGRGYYEEYKDGETLADYGISPVVIGGVTQTESDLVRRLWLDNDFYGATYSLNYTPKSNLNFTLGGAYNEYKGKHFDEVIWAQFANYDGSESIRHRYNDNDAFKTDFNTFLRANYQIDKFNIFGDFQYRHVYYSYFGIDPNGSPAQQNATLNFFNPKAGVTYNFNEKSNVYASVAIGNKEPNRRDFTDSNVNSRPKSEHLTDFEAGYRTQFSNLSFGINGFAMIYKDQLINTGKLNDVGGQTRQNVADSYRAGVEFDGRWSILKNFYWAATATLSRNKIKNFQEYLYDEVNGSLLVNNYNNTDISFSPSVIVSSELNYSILKNADIALLSKYVGRQYLNNTSAKSESLSSFFVNDIRLRYNTSFASVKNIGVSLLINNVFSTLYESNGASYPSLYGGELTRYNYYYPQATRNFLLSLSLKF
ncbi:TonB-dependent receptor [Pedobacter fastidiosus]|uniref:TonB-dependent receptor n=1 Tax=Pedobacter fastidiosus TaxID=2765361 RepID=A0ABR7KRB8_9SPHI|nr:TonB-dependent receptor [Pedobacter fastidiosus]MBC6110258.1 TonB-dependent receptor [Pedobacter fastidiosus]